MAVETIDLRSDTVTQPTEEMRRAMAEAAVGDDVFGEDPTVNRLEAEAARRLGKEAGLFVASGTMGNLVAVLSHCGRGDEIILGNTSHTFMYEAGGVAALGGVHPHPLPVLEDGTIPLEAIRAAIRAENIHYPPTRLIALENAQGSMTGTPVPKAYMDAVGELAHAHGLALHVDGARIFNAATALDCDVADLVAAADSVTFCLSKGLCAPVGSVLVGSQEFIARARRMRKIVGGGMRQVGVLAAAGLVALGKMSTRLAEDHRNARRLAEGLAQIPDFAIDPQRVRTNIVYVTLGGNARMGARAIAGALTERGVRVLAMDDQHIRAVTHYWIRSEHIERALQAFHEVLP